VKSRLFGKEDFKEVEMSKLEEQMYEDLVVAYDLILRLIDGEVSVMKLAVEDAVFYLNKNVKYAKRELH